MEKVIKFTAKVAPLAMKDVDTDLIIPAQCLTSVSRDGYGENLFRRLKDNDLNFVCNRAEFKDAKILVADDNFGCGSSREHAVWAIQGAGFKCVIAKSFADIFFNNSAKNGLLLITLPSAQIDKILKDAENGNYSLEIDLENQQINLPDGKSCKFDYDPFRKYCLLNGLDDIDYLLSQKADIEKYRQERKQYRFFRTTEANN